MKLTLNADKHSMYSIAKLLYFNFEDPGPKEIEAKSLSQEALSQIIYAVNTGVLFIDDPKEVNDLVDELSQDITVEVPISSAPDIVIEQAKELQTTKLKKLLSTNVINIKKELPVLKVSDLRCLVDLEKKEKNRATIINIANSLLLKHQEAVTIKLGTESPDHSISKTELLKGMSGVILDNISDVVDSEDKQVTLTEEDLKT
jgi:hypothetical protein